MQVRFGMPDTLPPLSRRELRGCVVFAGMGLFVLTVGLFPSLRPPPQTALPLAICWLALPAWGLLRFLTRKRPAVVDIPAEPLGGSNIQVGLYAVVMISAGVGFFFWARHLGLPLPVIFGTLLLIEGLGGVIVSLTEWWRLSHVGISAGLMAGGFLLPFVEPASASIPVGGAFFVGSLASAAILYWQLRRHESSLATRNAA